MKSRMICSFVIAGAMAGLPAISLAQVTTPSNNPLASQAQQVAEARKAVDAAKKQVAAIRRRVAASFESKDDWKAAKTALRQAQTAYSKANAHINEVIQKKPEYETIMQKIKESTAVLDSANQPASADKPKVSDDEINAAAKERTDAGLALEKLKRQTMDDDSTYLAAKQKLDEAKQQWDALQTQVDQAVKSDPEYAAAQQQVDQADQQYTQARLQLAQARKAQAAAAASARSQSSSSSSSSYTGGRPR